MPEGKNVLRRVIAVFDRSSAKKMEGEFEESLKRAGEKGGGASGKGFIREMRAEFDKKKAQLALDLASGAIDEKQWRKQSELAARTFNTTLIKSIDEARKQGQLTDREFIKLSRSIKRVGDEGRVSIGGKLTAALKGAALAAASLFAIHRIRAFATESVRAAIESEKSAQRLRAVWEANAGAVERSFGDLKRFTEELRNTTLFSRDEIELATAQLLTYKSISGDTFESTLKLATDLSSVFGGLTQSTAALARALDDPIRGLGELRRQGFTFSDQVTAQIKLLTQQNRLFDAQRLIIRELESEVGGVAEKMRTGWVGAVDQYGKAWEDLREAIGNFLLDSSNGASVLERLSGVMRSAAENIHEVAAAVKSLVLALGIMLGVRGLYGAAAAFRAANVAAGAFAATLRGFYVLLGPKGWFILGVAGLAKLFHEAGKAARDAARDAAEAIKLLDQTKSALTSRSMAEVESALEAAQANLDSLIAEKAERPVQVDFDPINRQIAAQSILVDELRAHWEKLNKAQATPDPPVDDAADRRIKIFNERRAAIEQEIADTRALAAVQEYGEEVIRSMTEQIEDNAAARAAAKDLTPQEAAALRELIDLRREARDELREAEDLRAAEEAAAARARTIEGMAQEIAILGEQAKAILAGADALEEFNRKEFIRQALLREGVGANTEHGRSVAELAAAHYDAAQAVESAWAGAADVIESEFSAMALTVGDVFHALASSGIAGLARLAKAKAIENLAWAAENIAKAIGAINPALSAKFMAAAGKHAAAAAAWQVAAAGARGVAGASGSSAAAGATAPNTQRAANAERPGAEVHINLYGDFDALNPRVQSVIQDASQRAQQRYGDNARIYTHRRSG